MAQYSDVPLSTVDVAPQGQTVPPGGKIAIHLKTPYGPQTVYVPAGMPQEDIISAVNQQILPQLQQQQIENSKQAAWRNSAIPIDTPFGRITVPPEIGSQIIGYGHGTSTFLNGLRQTVMGRDPQQDAEMAAGNKAFAPLAQQSLGARIADVAGQSAIPIAASLAFPALAPEAAAAATSTPAASLANAGLQAGAQGAVQYVPPGGSRVTNTVDAVKQGLLFQAPFSAAQKFAMGPKNVLTPPQQAAVQDAASIEGYKPLPSQLTGNPSLSNVEQLMGYFPFSGPQIAERNAANRTAINTAALKALGAPEGAQYGTPDVLLGLKKQATDVMDAVEAAGHPIQISPDNAAALRQIRGVAVNANTPNTNLAGTIDRLIGSDPKLSPDVASTPPALQAKYIESLGPAAYVQDIAPKYPNGIPADYFKTVQSDLSNWAKGGDYLSGQANSLLTESAIESLPGDLGTQLQQARQQYGGLMTADSAFNPATGDVNMRTLTQSLGNAGQDVAHYGESSNPILENLADLANTTRGVPPPPAEGSPTAQRMAWMKFLGLIPEGAAAGGAAYATHAATGGDLGLSALSAMLPFAAANYGTKAYLSPAFAQWAQHGVPTLGDIAAGLAPIGGAVVPAVAAATTSP